MRRFFIILFLAALTLSESVQAQRKKLSPDYYVNPVRNVSGLCSSNFGEMRPNHFHSGVDIKTDGVEGKPVVAVADGYIARIVLQPSGYGRALYVVHPNGTMSVYGHLSRFRNDLDSLALDRRMRSKRNAVDFYLPENQYRVKQGEVIALSGNTGSSYGPHLHFEIRDMRDNTSLNLIRQGIIRVEDSQPPRIEALHYVAVDTVGGIARHSAPRRIAVRQVQGGKYEVTAPVRVGRCGYFIAEVTDRKDNVQNRFGIYRITQTVDGEPSIEYRADGFRLEDSRYCNTVSHYPMQLKARCEVIRLAVQEGCPAKFFTTAVARGTVTANDGESRRMAIEVEDDCGNISTIAFDITGDSSIAAPTDPVEGEIVNYNRNFNSQFEDLSVTIPAGSLYESTPYTCSRSQRSIAADKGVEILTPVYEVMNDLVPLHTSATVAIKAYVPADMRSHVAMATISEGKLSYVGGKYRNGAADVQTRKLGAFCVVVDTAAPVITPKFEQRANLTKRATATFTISDNFSGIKEYSATVDGRWVPLEWMPVQGIFILRFADCGISGNTTHEITITATDNCSNTAKWHGTFIK